MSANDARGAAERASYFSTVAAGTVPGRRKAQRERSWLGRHRVLVAILMLGTLLLSACGGWLAYLNGQLSDVDRIALDLDENRRPDKVTGKAGEAVNILLAGADAGDGPSIAQAVAAGEWPAYAHRSDTIMVLHITADRDDAYLISVPRDAWVPIEGVGMSKINAAFAAGGPSLYLQTMEEFTGLRMDHLAIIDWNGFRDLTRAIGGVEVYVPEEIHDPSQGVTWEQGTQTLEGQRALQYVRMRYGLEEGDFDRIKRQQNFLRATMQTLLSSGVTNNPIKLTNSVEAITKYLTVDEDFTNREITSLAMSLRSLNTEDVTFLTVPRVGLDMIDGQSVVVIDEEKTRELFEAVSEDDLDSYLAKYDADVLGDARSVS